MRCAAYNMVYTHICMLEVTNNSTTITTNMISNTHTHTSTMHENYFLSINFEDVAFMYMSLPKKSHMKVVATFEKGKCTDTLVLSKHHNKKLLIFENQ